MKLVVTAIKKPNSLNYFEGETYEATDIGGGMFKIIDKTGEHILAPLQGSTLEFAIAE